MVLTSLKHKRANSADFFSESKSVRGAPEGSINLHPYSVPAAMRPVSSLIQNHRQFTATKTAAFRPPTPRSVHTPGVTTQNGTFIFQRHSPLVVSFLTVCLESPSVAVTATIRPPKSVRCINMPRPQNCLYSNRKTIPRTGSHFNQSHED